MIKAIIFDLFGTLTNGKGNPEKKIIKVFNLKHNYFYVVKFVCGTCFKDWDSYLGAIINGLNLPNTRETKKTLLNIFKQEFAKERINQEMVNQIKFLKSKKIKLGILSNIPNPIYDIIRKNNIQNYFDEILYSFNKGLIKPDPDFFDLMLSQLGVKCDETIMIGNSISSDIKPAKELGMNTIHFEDANQLKKELSSFSIDLVKQ